jgi:hypothetical protein
VYRCVLQGIAHPPDVASANEVVFSSLSFALENPVQPAALVARDPRRARVGCQLSHFFVAEFGAELMICDSQHWTMVVMAHWLLYKLSSISVVHCKAFWVHSFMVALTMGAEHALFSNGPFTLGLAPELQQCSTGGRACMVRAQMNGTSLAASDSSVQACCHFCFIFAIFSNNFGPAAHW